MKQSSKFSIETPAVKKLEDDYFSQEIGLLFQLFAASFCFGSSSLNKVLV
jgi:hypothetical protein